MLPALSGSLAVLSAPPSPKGRAGVRGDFRSALVVHGRALFPLDARQPDADGLGAPHPGLIPAFPWGVAHPRRHPPFSMPGRGHRIREDRWCPPGRRDPGGMRAPAHRLSSPRLQPSPDVGEGVCVEGLRPAPSSRRPGCGLASRTPVPPGGWAAPGGGTSPRSRAVASAGWLCPGGVRCRLLLVPAPP